jgi:hypothetical protein
MAGIAVYASGPRRSPPRIVVRLNDRQLAQGLDKTLDPDRHVIVRWNW